MQTPTPKIAIIGAGPAGLMAAETLSNAGFTPIVFDAKPSAGRKFLQAGRGGLNLTHDEDFALFWSRYFEAAPRLKPALDAFTPSEIRPWAEGLGFESFVGSSGKVYPLDKKAAPLLRAWIQRLKAKGTRFAMRHKLIEWQDESWLFQTPEGTKEYHFDGVILAFGGASWPQLGSTGEWVEMLQKKGLQITPLKPANMGFDVSYSKIFTDKFAGTPLKNITLSFRDIQGKIHSQLGELLISENGVEGSLVYTYSKYLRELIEQNSPVVISLDLFPHRSEAKLLKELSSKKAKQSLSVAWKRMGLSGVKASLLREVLTKEELQESEKVAKTLKNFPLKLNSPRPLVEAISTAGGLAFENCDSDLMLKKYKGIFCVGEMLDWEAPTGGYLLTGVMAQGKQAGVGLIKYLSH